MIWLFDAHAKVGYCGEKSASYYEIVVSLVFVYLYVNIHGQVLNQEYGVYGYVLLGIQPLIRSLARGRVKPTRT